MKTRLAVLIAACAVAGCGADEPPAADAEVLPHEGGTFVHLFEWHWPDVAAECETVLGPAGYTAVQVSPPNEHITGPAWWTRYQPVSYLIESRGGTREEFADMVKRCGAAGVAVYADAITNHMAGFPSGVGVAGSEYAEYDYPAVPYGYDDFHHCGRNEDDRIGNYQDLYEVQNCQLGTLDDLDTGKPAVQAKIAAYLDDLASLGVAGFRMDAAKHVWHEEIAQILARVDGRPFVYQEVIDRGDEPVSAMDYVDTGLVTEFKYPHVMVEAFENGKLGALTDFWEQPGWLPGDKAIVFVDNHDVQRGHAASGEIINYKDGASYDLAVAFMLAHPYGYPMVMSSYAFEDDQQGPPASSPLDEEQGCGAAWICEHRRAAIAGFVTFRRATHGTDLGHWQVVDGVVSFGRGDKGHAAINTGGAPARIEVPTGLPAGEYTDIVTGEAQGIVGEDGLLRITVPAQRAVAILSD
jgi:alpha-amylase